MSFRNLLKRRGVSDRSNRARTAQLKDLPDSSFAIEDQRKLLYLDEDGEILKNDARTALSVLNGARGGIMLTKTKKIEAWNRVVRAIRESQPNYVPPPRRF